MNRLRIALLSAAFLAGAVATPMAQADSLWTPNSVSLFSDNKARRAGDVLTVRIAEQTQSSAQANTRTAKSEDFSLGPGTGPILDLIKKFGLSTGSNTNASGQTARNGSLTGRIAVTVKSVDANGNLVLEGARDITLNAEKQRIVFRGLVRPADIQPDNTVASSLVADATIEFVGKGVIGDRQRPGIISRVFKFLF